MDQSHSQVRERLVKQFVSLSEPSNITGITCKHNSLEAHIVSLLISYQHNKFLISYSHLTQINIKSMTTMEVIMTMMMVIVMRHDGNSDDDDDDDDNDDDGDKNHR